MQVHRRSDPTRTPRQKHESTEHHTQHLHGGKLCSNVVEPNSMTWSVAATCVDVGCLDLSMQVQIKTGLSHSRWIKCIFKLNLYACD